MPKQKTHSGAKKRFKVTGKGKVKSGAACLRHGMRKRSQDMKRAARGTFVLAKQDGETILKHYLKNA